MLNQRKDEVKNAVESAGAPAKPSKRAPIVETVPSVKKAAKKAVSSSKVARPSKAKAVSAPAVIARQEITREDIAKLAYLLWESRGYSGGSPEDDWLKAEALLRDGSMAIS